MGSSPASDDDWFAHTKLAPPTLRSGTLQRQHLCAVLQQAVATCPLTLSSAPAGSGKTTLLVDWLDATRQEGADAAQRPGPAAPPRRRRVGYGLAADGLTNAAGVSNNILYLALLTQMSDMRLVGPMIAAMNPLFGLLARLARRLGVEADLLARYGA